MKKDMKVKGRFYFKNGVIIDEEVVIDKDNDQNMIETEKQIRYAFRSSENFEMKFGNTVFRGSELCAITFNRS